MTTSIPELLQQIYTHPDQIAETQRALEVLIANAPKPATTPGERFGQRDVVLITYGDSLRREGDKPLRTLRDFLHEHLRGVIPAVHILPFYPSSSDDGFAVQDYLAVDPALGDWDDVRALGQDFDLMFDAVFNHMSAQSEAFARFLADEPDGPRFRTEDPATDLSGVVRPRAMPLLTPFTQASGETVHVWTTFSADQVDLDLRHPPTLVFLLEVLLHYVLHQGARFIRLDAIAYLWKEVGTSCIHLPQTHAIIRLMRAVLDEVAPQTVLITETNVPHDENVAYFGKGHDEAQMVYNFTLPPLLFHTLLTGDATQLRDWVNTLKTPSDETTFFNFTASHDGIGVRPVEGILSAGEIAAMIAHVERRGGRVSYKRNADGSESPYELNCSYLDAITDPAESETLQIRRFLLSQALMLSLAGVPAIYIHSLLGSRNDIAGMQRTGHARSINREKLDADALKGALKDEQSFRARIFTAYRHLIEMRSEQAAFHPNAAQVALPTEEPALFALRRTHRETGSSLLALYNLRPAPLTVDLGGWLPQGGTDVLSGRVRAGRVSLGAYDVMWLRDAAPPTSPSR